MAAIIADEVDSIAVKEEGLMKKTAELTRLLDYMEENIDLGPYQGN